MSIRYLSLQSSPAYGAVWTADGCQFATGLDPPFGISLLLYTHNFRNYS